GILSGLDVFANIADGFKAQMTELGYIEGMNIIYDFQKANVDVPAERVILKRFVDSKVDLIFAFPTEPALLAKEATKGTNIPVIFAQGGVEGSGLVQSIAYPGDNITGVRYPGPDVLVRRLEIMHELIPEAKRFYLTYQLDYPTVRLALIAIRPVASVLGVTLVEVPIKTVEDIEADLNARDNLNDVGIDAILIVPESLSQSPRGFGAIIKFANKHKIPLAASNIKSGAVFSYTSDNIETGRLAASLADKIFKGVPAGTIMVATPTSDLRLNYKLAQELGLNVSKRLMGLAKEVTR
ncbi:MAG: ABC transporter substrate-binding protein, partial [Candidatus Omnitrophica bacterium]|nr:ABC transporter substrate-binding protein [Candidatus Omnitrophota bacterium]